MDVLREDLAAGRIRPEQMNKISMEQAVRRTHEYDEALKAKMLNARIAEQANANVFKEYPEGYKWVQLDKPGQFSLESDIMGHSVRGYEPPKGHPDYTDISGDSGYGDYGHGGYEAIKSGDAKIYSLRDPKGMSHVTVEVGKAPLRTWDDVTKAVGKEKAAALHKEFYDIGADRTDNTEAAMAMFLKNKGVQPVESITQIKGKQNAAPNEEYLPFVQDFVKSGQYSDVGDLKNTGLYKADPDELGMFIPSDPRLKNLPGRRTDDLRKAKEAGLFGDKQYLTRNEWEDILRKQIESESGPLPPAEGMAEGGGAFKKISFYGGGGITTTAGTFSPEELGVNPSELPPDVTFADMVKYAKRIGKNAADLAVQGKESLSETYERVKDSPRARAQLAKVLALQTVGGVNDFAHIMVADPLAEYVLDPIKSKTIDRVLTKPKYRSVLAPKLKKGEKEEREPIFGSISNALVTDDGYPIGGSEHMIKRAQQAGLMFGRDYPLLNEDGSYAIDPETNQPYQSRSGRFNLLTEIGGGLLGGLGLSKLGKVAKKGYVKNIEPRVDPAGALTRAINLDYPDADFNQNYLRAR
jgi:hypothetical protein